MHGEDHDVKVSREKALAGKRVKRASENTGTYVQRDCERRHFAHHSPGGPRGRAVDRVAPAPASTLRVPRRPSEMAAINEGGYSS